MTKQKASHLILDQWVRWSLAGMIVCLGLAAVYWRVEPMRSSDSDRYFHVEMARRMAEGVSTPTTPIPELKDTLGETHFDSYWMFSWILAAAHRVDGESGVTTMGFVFVAATLLLLLWLAHERLTIGVSMLLVFGVLLNPEAMRRLLLFRPHVFSILMFCVAAAALMKRNRHVAFVAGLLHVWSYQFPFIPAVLFASAAAAGGKRDKALARAGWMGLAGTVAGMFVNPYFPQNVASFIDVYLAMGPAGIPSPAAAASMPTEMTWLDHGSPAWALLFFAAPLILLVIRCVPRLSKAVFKREFRTPNAEALWLALCLGGFWMLTLISGKGLEYVIPSSILAWVVFLGEWKRENQRAAFALVAIAFCIPTAWGSYVRTNVLTAIPKIVDAYAALPDCAEGRKVLNMSARDGAFLMYAKPGYRFVDYRPGMLGKVRPDLRDLRHALAGGRVADVFGAARFKFDAAFISTVDGPLRDQLEASPHFRKYADVELMPGGGRRFYIYEAAPRRLPLQVKRYDYSVGSGASGGSAGDPRAVASGQADSAKWAPWESDVTLPADQKTTFVSLGKGDRAGCTRLRPDFSSQAILYGTSLMAIGGAGEAKVYWNGQPLFKSVLGKTSVREAEAIVTLPKPLSKSDDVVIEVCGVADQGMTGITTSFFTPGLLGKLCTWKGNSPEEDKEWRYTAGGKSTCIASFAQPR